MDIVHGFYNTTNIIYYGAYKFKRPINFKFLYDLINKLKILRFSSLSLIYQDDSIYISEFGDIQPWHDQFNYNWYKKILKSKDINLRKKCDWSLEFYSMDNTFTFDYDMDENDIIRLEFNGNINYWREMMVESKLKELDLYK
ncbi:MAG: hypothetical protein IJ193_08140 [Bacilli bacterium]|nr:hypothetical protein [Bacilli bacterium]